MPRYFNLMIKYHAMTGQVHKLPEYLLGLRRSTRAAVQPWHYVFILRAYQIVGPDDTESMEQLLKEELVQDQLPLELRYLRILGASYVRRREYSKLFELEEEYKQFKIVILPAYFSGVVMNLLHVLEPHQSDILLEVFSHALPRLLIVL